VDTDTVFMRISNNYLFVWKKQGGGEWRERLVPSNRINRGGQNCAPL
jgi:hypothetical protein